LGWPVGKKNPRRTSMMHWLDHLLGFPIYLLPFRHRVLARAHPWRRRMCSQREEREVWKGKKGAWGNRRGDPMAIWCNFDQL
jgi:hypothetical protein